MYHHTHAIIFFYHCSIGLRRHYKHYCNLFSSFVVEERQHGSYNIEFGNLHLMANIFTLLQDMCKQDQSLISVMLLRMKD